VHANPTGRQSLWRQRQYNLIDTGQATLTLLDDLRIERAIGVARRTFDE
jgi:hypothetical protein